MANFPPKKNMPPSPPQEGMPGDMPVNQPGTLPQEQPIPQRDEMNERTVSTLTSVFTKEYRHPVGRINDLYRGVLLNPNQPIFQRYWVPAMLADPHIKLGLSFCRAPIISKAKYEVECDDQDIADYVTRQLELFMNRGMPRALQCFLYGHIGLECLYEFNEDRNEIDFKDFKWFRQQDVHPAVDRSDVVGIFVDQYETSSSIGMYNISDYGGRQDSCAGDQFIGFPKAFWAVHNPDHDPIFGQSLLEGAFIPWYETWQEKGYRAIRHLWLYKNAFSSGLIRYPEGATEDAETGQMIPNPSLASKILDMRETGSGIAIPTLPLEFGNWDYEDPTSTPVPEGLFTYGDELKTEKWEGMEIPSDVLEQEGTGSFSGRRTSQQGFYSNLQEKANHIVYSFDEQCLQKLVKFRQNGDYPKYVIKPIPIVQTLQEEEMGAVTGKLPNDNSQMEDGSDPSQDFEDPNQNGPSILSNGRIEDRKSNPFNKAEQARAS